jgi:hypothetical protein
MTPRAAILAALAVWGAAGCARGESARGSAPAEAADAMAAGRIGEVTIPVPPAAVGDRVEWRREASVGTKARLYRDGKWRGNVSVVGERRMAIAIETLAVAAGQPSRLRLRYASHHSIVKVGGSERPAGPALEGRVFDVELEADPVRVTAADGERIDAPLVERVARDVSDLVLPWRSLAGRRLLPGETVALERPRGTTATFKGTRGGAALVGLKAESLLDLPAGLEMQATLHGEALLDLSTGRPREIRSEAAGTLTTTRFDRGGKSLLSGMAQLVQVDVSTPAELR